MCMITDTKEKGLETLIVDWLRDQNGYEQGLPGEYNKVSCVGINGSVFL